MTSDTPASGQTVSTRINFIDLLRGWAVIVMIETHVLNATLAPGVTSGALFQYVKFVNGLVAPAFLFASGLAFAVTTRRKLNDYLSFGAPFYRQIGRLLLILGIGYLLHVPVFSLGRLLEGTTEEQRQSFFQVDVLQCIAVTLLLLQVLLLAARSERRLYRLALFLVIVFVGASPWVWTIDFWNVIPWPAAAYMNGMRYSLFPLFPWSAFLLAGAIAGYSYLRASDRAHSNRDADAESRFARTLPWIGGSAILLSMALDPLAGKIFPPHDYWRAGPPFFFLRLGLVVLLSALLLFFDRARRPSSSSIVTLFGRESLFIYVLHLLIIYGNFGTFNFRRTVDQSFGYPAALISTAVLLLLMYFAASFWSRTKRKSPRLKLLLSLGTLVFVTAMFLFGEG